MVRMTSVPRDTSTDAVASGPSSPSSKTSDTALLESMNDSIQALTAAVADSSAKVQSLTEGQASLTAEVMSLSSDVGELKRDVGELKRGHTILQASSDNVSRAFEQVLEITIAESLRIAAGQHPPAGGGSWVISPFPSSPAGTFRSRRAVVAKDGLKFYLFRWSKPGEVSLELDGRPDLCLVKGPIISPGTVSPGCELKKLSVCEAKSAVSPTDLEVAPLRAAVASWSVAAALSCAAVEEALGLASEAALASVPPPWLGAMLVTELAALEGLSQAEVRLANRKLILDARGAEPLRRF